MSETVRWYVPGYVLPDGRPHPLGDQTVSLQYAEAEVRRLSESDHQNEYCVLVMDRPQWRRLDADTGTSP